MAAFHKRAGPSGTSTSNARQPSWSSRPIQPLDDAELLFESIVSAHDEFRKPVTNVMYAIVSFGAPIFWFGLGPN